VSIPAGTNRRRLARPSAWLFAVLVVAGLAAAAAQAPLPSTPSVAVPDFPLATVAAGMTGYALTTGPGDVIERFPVEVVGVQYEAAPGLDLVLVRVSGPFIDASGGVAAGMSGSPVYLVDGGRPALLGAIGYVFPNADHRLALVTPIATMRAELTTVSRPPAVELEGFGRAVPVATPILLTGATARAMTLLEPLFDAGAVAPFPSQAGGSGQPTSPDFALVPGAAVAVRLMTGAVDLSAVGTVTSVDGARLLAFGHPFLGFGPVSYDLAPAHVTTIVHSDVVPFKLANVGTGSLGAVVLDAPAALAGVTGAAPDTLPLTITIDTGSSHEVFELSLAADERLYPTLTAIATLQLVDRSLRMTSAGHADLAWEISLGAAGRLNMLEQVSSPSDIALDSARLAGGPLALLATNAFQAPTVTGIDLSVNLSTEQNHAAVSNLVLEEATVPAGGHAIVHVRLQPFRRQAIVRTFSVAIPAALSGEVTLLVRGGDVPRDIEDVPEEGGEVAEPRSFPELLDAMRDQLQASELIIESIDDYGDVRRLLRTPLPFVVMDSQEVTLTVAGEESDAELLLDAVPAPGSAGSAAGDEPDPAEEGAPRDPEGEQGND